MYFSDQGNVDDDATFITTFLVSFNLQSCCFMQSAVCSLQSAVCGLRSAVCGLRSAVCSLRSAVCGLQSAVCSLQSANVIHRNDAALPFCSTSSSKIHPQSKAWLLSIQIGCLYKRSLISSLCLSTSICSFQHCYLCLPRLLENRLYSRQFSFIIIALLVRL